MKTASSDLDERARALFGRHNAHRLWSYLMLRFGAGEWFTVSVRSIGAMCGLSHQQTRSSLEWLINNGFVSKGKSTTSGVCLQLLRNDHEPALPLPEKPKPKKERLFLRAEECYRMVEDYTPSEPVREAFCRWIDMRYAKAGEHRLTAEALEVGIRRIKNLGYMDEGSAVMCIDQSTFHCWDGFFPLE